MNKNCKYFPCHKGMEDCSQCYCMFYDICPSISSGLTGGYWLISDKFPDGKVWACEQCVMVHMKWAIDYINENHTKMDKRQLLNELIKQNIQKQ